MFQAQVNDSIRCHFSTCVSANFADKNQLSGFSINGKLVENILIQEVLSIEANKKSENNSA